MLRCAFRGAQKTRSFFLIIKPIVKENVRAVLPLLHKNLLTVQNLTTIH